MQVHMMSGVSVSTHDCGMFMIDPGRNRLYLEESVHHLLKVEEHSQWKVTGVVLLLDAGVVGGAALGELGKMRTWMASCSP